MTEYVWQHEETDKDREIRKIKALESIAQSLVKLSYCMEVQSGLRPDAMEEEEWLKKIQ